MQILIFLLRTFPVRECWILNLEPRISSQFFVVLVALPLLSPLPSSPFVWHLSCDIVAMARFVVVCLPVSPCPFVCPLSRILHLTNYSEINALPNCHLGQVVKGVGDVQVCLLTDSQQTNRPRSLITSDRTGWLDINEVINLGHRMPGYSITF